MTAAADRVPWLRALMACLWAAGLVRVFADAPALRGAAVVALGIYLLLSLPGCGRLSLTVAGLAGGAATLTSALTWRWRPLFDGLAFALVFTVFLPTLVLLRTTIDVSPEVWRSRTAFAEMPLAERTSGMLAGGGALGPVLTLGVFPVLAPLVPRDAGLAVRGDMARAVLRGLALSLFWSPFTVNMAVVLSFRPEVQLWQVVGAGLPLAVLGTGLSVAMFGRGAGARGALHALAGFRPILLPLGAAMLAVMAAAGLAPLGTIEAIVLVMPPLCVFWLWFKRRGLVAAALARSYRRLDRLGGDLLVFVGAVCLARVLLEAPFFAALMAQPAIAALPTAAIIAGAMALGFALALAGLHSLVTASLVIALLTPLADRIAGLVAVLTMLYGSACGAVLSVSALSVLVSSSSFRVPVPMLLFRQNAAFMAALGAIVFALLAALNRLLTG